MGDRDFNNRMDKFMAEQRDTQQRMAQVLESLSQIMIDTNNNNQVGNSGESEDNSSNNRTPSRHVPTTSSRPMIPIFPPRIDPQGGNEPTLVELQDQFCQDWLDGGFFILYIVDNHLHGNFVT